MKHRYPLFGPNANGTIQPRAGAKLGNFGNPKEEWNAAVTPIRPSDAERIKQTYEWPVPVILPRTAHAPEGARTVDLRRQVSVAAGATVDLISWVGLGSATTVFFAYGLILPAGGAPDVEWFPTVEQQRVFQYHGDPGVNVSSNPETHLNMATGTDFSDIALIGCQLLMQPGQQFLWRAKNNTGAPVVMGIRLKGYVDLSQQLLSSKFGD